MVHVFDDIMTKRAAAEVCVHKPTFLILEL